MPKLRRWPVDTRIASTALVGVVASADARGRSTSVNPGADPILPLATREPAGATPKCLRALANPHPRDGPRRCSATASRAVRLSLEKFARLFLSNNDDETNTRVCDGETRRSTATAAGTRRSIHSFLDERWGDAAFSFASMADIVTQLHDSVRERSRPHSSRSRPLPWRSLARSPRPPHPRVRAFRPSLNDPSPLPSTRR